ncbi:MAG: hypothetical protein WC223_12535 [Bacteroidales bacterium]|jgi:hypothetical protein
MALQLKGFSTEEAGNALLKGITTEETADALLRGFAFEEKNNALLLGCTVEEVLVKPVLMGFIFTESDFNFNCVVTDRKGEPIENAVVSISDEMGTNEYTTNADGSVEGRIRRNTETIIAITKKGYKNYLHKFTLTDNDNIDWRITLFKAFPLVITEKGYAVNLEPYEPENIVFN